MNISNLALQKLSTLSICGVFALYNDLDKRIYVGYSKNILNAMVRILVELKRNQFHIEQMNLDFEKLHFKIIETVHDPSLLKVVAQQYMDYYSNNGYTLYRNNVLVKYKLRVSIRPVKRGNNLSHLYLFFLHRVNSRNDSSVIGIFNSEKELNAFLKYINNNPNCYAIAFNPVTKEYFLKNKENIYY